MTPLPRFLVGPSLALLLAGCAASDYAYVPAQAPTAHVGGRVAADYPIPAQSPKGQLKVLSYGVVSAGTDSGDNARPALHVRLVVTNSSARPWSLDTREQQVTIAGHPGIGVAFASASPGGAQPPLVDIAAGKSRTLDLFFPVPANDDSASAVPGFDLRWRVNTGEAIFVGATQFDRTEVSEEVDQAYVAGPYDYCLEYYWCGPYWYNPLYPYWGFGVGAVVLGPRWWGHHYYLHGGYWHGYYRGGGYHGGFHGGGFHAGGGFHGGGGHHR